MVSDKHIREIERRLLNWDKPMPKFWRFMKWLLHGMPNV